MLWGRVMKLCKHYQIKVVFENSEKAVFLWAQMHMCGQERDERDEDKARQTRDIEKRKGVERGKNREGERDEKRQ